MDLLRIEYVRVVLAHLGYPMYLLTILGVWRIPGTLALLVPRFARLKEWAYAGAFFNYTSATASHLAIHDGPSHWLLPLIFAALTLVSWALRPPSRRLFTPPRAKTSVFVWGMPVILLIAMLLLTAWTLPTTASLL